MLGSTADHLNLSLSQSFDFKPAFDFVFVVDAELPLLVDSGREKSIGAIHDHKKTLTHTESLNHLGELFLDLRTGDQAVVHAGLPKRSVPPNVEVSFSGQRQREVGSADLLDGGVDFKLHRNVDFVLLVVDAESSVAVVSANIKFSLGRQEQGVQRAARDFVHLRYCLDLPGLSLDECSLVSQLTVVVVSPRVGVALFGDHAGVTVSSSQVFDLELIQAFDLDRSWIVLVDSVAMTKLPVFVFAQ